MMLNYPNLPKLDKFNITCNNILPRRQEKCLKFDLLVKLVYTFDLSLVLNNQNIHFCSTKTMKVTIFFSAHLVKTKPASPKHSMVSCFPVLSTLEFANDSKYRNAPCYK